MMILIIDITVIETISARDKWGSTLMGSVQMLCFLTEILFGSPVTVSFQNFMFVFAAQTLAI